MVQPSPQPSEKFPATSWIILSIVMGAMLIFSLKDTLIIINDEADAVTTVWTISDWIGWSGWATLMLVGSLHFTKGSIMRERLGMYTLMSIMSVGWVIEIAAHLPHAAIILIVMQIIAILLSITAIAVWHHTTKYETAETQETDET